MTAFQRSQIEQEWLDSLELAEAIRDAYADYPAWLTRTADRAVKIMQSVDAAFDRFYEQAERRLPQQDTSSADRIAIADERYHSDFGA